MIDDQKSAMDRYWEFKLNQGSNNIKEQMIAAGVPYVVNPYENNMDDLAKWLDAKVGKKHWTFVNELIFIDDENAAVEFRLTFG